jgi:hypothetical protein
MLTKTMSTNNIISTYNNTTSTKKWQTLATQWTPTTWQTLTIWLTLIATCNEYKKHNEHHQHRED